MNASGIYVAAGLALLLAATVPRALRDRPISAPLVVMGVGAVAGFFLDSTETISPSLHPAVTQRLCEACVIVALMGTGLAIDRPLSWRAWSSTWRLLIIAMPIGIAAMSLIGWWAAALPPAAAVLLGATLAPTDPVLASDVQVEGPTTSNEQADGSDDEVRFALTSEAGLNDALAFPFVYLALFMMRDPIQDWALRWVAWELLGKTFIGAAVGWAVGYLLGHAVFHSKLATVRLADRGEPIFALAATFFVYGVAEAAGGYGFLAVFVCAVAIRRTERSHDYHGEMHSMIEQLEHVLTLSVLLLLGAAITSGLFSHLTWGSVVVALALIFVVRPLSGWLALLGSSMAPSERRVTAFFGIRGIGSVYYLSYAAAEAGVAQEEALWSAVALTIVGSVIIHGASATRVMRVLDRRRNRGELES